MKRDAVISDCGTYRYLLSREWADGPTCTFIMLNPSTADGKQDDPTIRRCINFAKRERCGKLFVVNLMAFRATDPSKLPLDDRAVGPDNSNYIFKVAAETDGPIISAWGANKAADRYALSFMKAARRRDLQLYCLKLTASGHPGHPLYVKSDAPLKPYPEFTL